MAIVEKNYQVCSSAKKNNQLQILLTEKDRSNLLINQKNDQLQVLLSEKDWLLKEVHHRVKKQFAHRILPV